MHRDIGCVLIGYRKLGRTYHSLCLEPNYYSEIKFCLNFDSPIVLKSEVCQVWDCVSMRSTLCIVQICLVTFYHRVCLNCCGLFIHFNATCYSVYQGYFQLKANPGAWRLQLRQGRSHELYDIVG